MTRRGRRLSPIGIALREAAVDGGRHAYVPYSHFHVGAAGLTDDGRIITGCNVENASYGLTLCAECARRVRPARERRRTARRRRAVGNGVPVMPCGRCRQLLWEHGGPDCLLDGDGTPQPMRDVLPGAFDASRLLPADGRGPHHPGQAGRSAAHRRGDPLVPVLLHGRRGGRGAGVGPPDGHLLPGAGRPRARHLDRGDDRQRRSAGPPRRQPPDRGQALDGWRGRQDQPPAVPARRRLRCGRATAVRPGAGPHRRDPRQDGVDRRVAGAPVAPGDRGSARARRRSDLRGGGRPRAGRPSPVRPARRDRHGRVHPPDRQLDHVEEARRGHVRARCST